MTAKGLGLTLSAAVALFGCHSQPAAAPEAAKAVPLAEAPAEWKPAIAKADAAIEDLKVKLRGRNVEEVQKNGRAAAINMCQNQALAITATIGQEHGVELGRTSHKLRNPANAPREWVKPYVAEYAGKPAMAFKPVAVDLGDRVGVLKPIAVMAECQSCHGTPDKLDPQAVEALKAQYPDDQATGFSEGELRGLLWAEVKK